MPANRQNTHPQFVKVRGSLLVLGLTLDGKGESNHTAFIYLVSLDIILSTDITDGVICCMQVYLQRQCYNRLYKAQNQVTPFIMSVYVLFRIC